MFRAKAGLQNLPSSKKVTSITRDNISLQLLHKSNSFVATESNVMACRSCDNIAIADSFLINCYRRRRDYLQENSDLIRPRLFYLLLPTCTATHGTA